MHNFVYIAAGILTRDRRDGRINLDLRSAANNCTITTQTFDRESLEKLRDAITAMLEAE